MKLPKAQLFQKTLLDCESLFSALRSLASSNLSDDTRSAKQRLRGLALREDGAPLSKLHALNNLLCRNGCSSFSPLNDVFGQSVVPDCIAVYFMPCPP
jgi:hypothetical protein